MTFARPDHTSDLETLSRRPAWVTSARAEIFEDVAFLSGAALRRLHVSMAVQISSLWQIWLSAVFSDLQFHSLLSGHDALGRVAA